MIRLHFIIHKLLLTASALLLLQSSTLIAAPLNIANTPLLLNKAVAPLTMIVMGRNHKLFYEAYNNASDLDGDGVLDTKYKPDLITYYGYFDSHKCYQYINNRFEPFAKTSNKKCSGSWSGDFLNYVTTARIDALRKVLYGGYRSTDSATETILERTAIPQDAHSWGIEYTSPEQDGFQISEYTPLNLPLPGTRHLFANTTLLNSSDQTPRLRIAANQPYRIWEWVSIERPVADSQVATGNNQRVTISDAITDYIVRVKVCVANIGIEDNCRAYPNGSYKPIGLLQNFGENKSMKFGLLMGSYSKNLSGGVLRKRISDLSDEINPQTGQFTSVNGIVSSIDKLKIPGFGENYQHACGFIFDRIMNEGECDPWGNPIAEMLYEATRYFAGNGSPTAEYVSLGGTDTELGLPIANWDDPYSPTINPHCAKPNILLISDISPSYDSDQLPGSYYGGISNDLSPSLNVSTLADTIWNQEFGAPQYRYIGESGSDNNNIDDDGIPTAKLITSFSNIRGLVDDPNKRGSYYSASVAYHAWTNDMHSVKETQNIKTFAIALALPLPEINIAVKGKTITLVPLAKSVGGCMNTDPQFWPTNTIVDYYVESLTNTSGTFRINFEEGEQGGDHDMDAIIKYSYTVNQDDTVTITVDSVNAAGCIIQHAGYAISGTTSDGVYLEVRDADTLSDVDFLLDTPPFEVPGGNWDDNTNLPLTATRTFTPSNTPAAQILPNPLWYAAKWGGFTDQNNNNVPDLPEEYDINADGVPDNYYLVTNTLNLRTQLYAALNNMTSRTASATAVVSNSGTLNQEARIYQALFNSGDWSGQLLAFNLDQNTGLIKTNGTGPNGSQWDAGQKLTQKNYDAARVIVSYDRANQQGIPFRWANLSSTAQTLFNLNADTGSADGLGTKRVNYLRGQRAFETNKGGMFRDRHTILGDIVHSNPALINAPAFHYPDTWVNSSFDTSIPYSSFKFGAMQNRMETLYIGSNDSMLHGFDTATRQAVLSYVPSQLWPIMNLLTSPNYAHRYYVDGPMSFNDVFFDSRWHTVLTGGLAAGGQQIYALDVTDPSSFSEANANNIVLWEFNDENDADLGYTFSQPSIARTYTGAWTAIFGNGYNNTVNDGHVSSTGNAVLYIVDIKTGALIKKIDTGVGMSADPLGLGRPNGLSTPSIVDIDGDHIADYVYAGDLFGNLWKFEINSNNVSQWGIAFNGSPLFIARANDQDETTRQPIVSQPTVSPKVSHQNQHYFIVYFGTGKYLETSDKTDQSIQSFYAIFDEDNAVSSRSGLLQQNITGETTVTDNNGVDYNIRLTSSNTLSTSHQGWFIDLVYGSPQGERQISSSIIRNNKIIFTTLIPNSDPCGSGGDSWLMELDSRTGSPLRYSPFDLNGDTTFSSKDFYNGQSPSGLKSTVGITTTPNIINDGSKEYKYTSGSSGNKQRTIENPGPTAIGRQSWRELQ